MNRTRYTATYDYPGLLFPESAIRSLAGPGLDDILAAAPADTEGYFRADGWYAVTVTGIDERRFVDPDTQQEAWVEQGRTRVTRIVIGERVHVDDIPDTDANRILRSNIRANTPDGHGVKTRAGNWQFASDYDTVLAPEAVA